MRFLDTNILLYSISTAPEEAHKRSVATELLAGIENALSAQVLQEFYVQATHSRRQHPLDPELALALMERWERFPIVPIGPALVRDAARVSLQAKLSYWDSAIVAAAAAAGCDELLTEDLNHGQVVSGVKVRNPFQ